MPQNPSVVRHVRITESDQGQRVDNFLLKTLKGVPRSHVYRLLRTGQVRINGGRVRAQTRLSAGDQVRLPPWRGVARDEPSAAPDALRGRVASALIYEDDRFVIVDKPSGLAVHGGSGIRFGLIEVLRQMRPDATGWELAHRIDRQTSGCLLVAKDRQALLEFHGLLRKGGVEKEYDTLLVGEWRGGARDVDRALVKNRERGGERMVEVAGEGERGQRALSRFTPQLVTPVASLMRVRIETGRTHQIRVHAASLGMPVAGDDKYGSRAANRQLRTLGLKRLFLHARRLTFTLPESGYRLEVEAPLPEELQRVVSQLEGGA